MQDNVVVTGMVLKVEPIGEYDRRVVILTTDRGKISAFAKGARKPNSRFVASTNLFVFGRFVLFPGRSSYTINDVEVDEYFDGMRIDVGTTYYGTYFLEIADYYARENNDDKELLKLLYQSIRALLSPRFDNRLVRAVYEIKAVVVNGEFPGIHTSLKCSDDTRYTVDYIVNSSATKLYTFSVSDNVLKELEAVAADTMKRVVGAHFNSLELIDMMN